MQSHLVCKCLHAREGEGRELVEVDSLAVCRENFWRDLLRLFSNKADTQWVILILYLVVILGNLQALEPVKHIFSRARRGVFNIGLQVSCGGIHEPNRADITIYIQAVCHSRRALPSVALCEGRADSHVAIKDGGVVGDDVVADEVVRAFYFYVVHILSW